MKNKATIAILTFTLLIAGSCKKFLDIQPQFKFADTLATSTLDGLYVTTVGAFNELQSGNLYGGGIIANSELLADFVNTDPISDYSLNQLRSHQMDGFNGQIGGMWSDAYRAILIANIVLDKLPNFEGHDADSIKRIKGECLFIRGVMHFELVRMFAQPSGYTSNDSHLGIPIRLTPGTLTEGQTTPRSTVAEVYNQVIADLMAADSLLPATPSGATVFATKYAAEGFLMRAYFEQHKYSDALTWADNIINHAGLSLNDSVTSIYNLSGNSYDNEVVYQLINVAPKDVSNGALTGRFKQTVFPAMYRMSDEFIPYLKADSAAGSLRFAKLYKRLGTKYFTKKYDNLNMNVPVLRLAEVYLTRAECNAQLNMGDALVRADYNLVRKRAGLPEDNSTSGQAALLAAVRGERDMELAFEGDRYFELKRRQQDFNTPYGTYAWNSDVMIYPIPVQEIENNSAAVQNPGY